MSINARPRPEIETGIREEVVLLLWTVSSQGDTVFVLVWGAWLMATNTHWIKTGEDLFGHTSCHSDLFKWQWQWQRVDRGCLSFQLRHGAVVRLYLVLLKCAMTLWINFPTVQWWNIVDSLCFIVLVLGSLSSKQLFNFHDIRLKVLITWRCLNLSLNDPTYESAITVARTAQPAAAIRCCLHTWLFQKYQHWASTISSI